MGDSNQRFLKINVISTHKHIPISPVLEFAYFVKLNIIIDIFRSVKLSKTYAGSRRPIVTTFSTQRSQGHFQFTILTLTGAFSLLCRGRERPGNINARLPPTPETRTPPSMVNLPSQMTSNKKKTFKKGHLASCYLPKRLSVLSPSDIFFLIQKI